MKNGGSEESSMGIRPDTHTKHFSMWINLWESMGMKLGVQQYGNETRDTTVWDEIREYNSMGMRLGIQQYGNETREYNSMGTNWEYMLLWEQDWRGHSVWEPRPATCCKTFHALNKL